MVPIYRHTQVGVLLAASLLVAAVVVSVALVISPMPNSWMGVLFAVCITSLLFPRLTTEVYTDHVQCTFGPGLVRRRVLIRDICAIAIVRSSPFYGWGLRWIPNGWLWNVSGLEAIELRLSSGRRFWIGTDEPEQLSAALAHVLGAG